MAQPTSRPPYAAWSHIPPAEGFLPPAKRQRLSPNPASPYATSPPPSYVNSSSQSNLNLSNMQNMQRFSSSTPDATRATQGIMGPPQRPVEKAEKNVEKGAERHMDINDLSDLVTSSGIDLREEENYLANSYRSSTALGHKLPPQNNFDLLPPNQGTFSIGENRGSAGFNRLTVSAQTAEQELFEKHRKAARDLNEKRQFHLEDPFLWGASLRSRLHKVSSDTGVKLPMEGLFDRIPECQPGDVTRQTTTAPDGTIVTMSTPSILSRNAPLDGIISLLSLAANERVRGLLEDAYGMARGRRMGSDGIVPPDWADLAVGEGGMTATTKPASITGTSWDAPGVVKQDDSLTIGAHSNHLPSPPASNPDATAKFSEASSLPTIAFSSSGNPLSRALNTLTLRDREAEESRIRRRDERARARAAGLADGALGVTAGADSATPGTAAAAIIASGGSGANMPVPPASGTLGERAPEVKMTKKERERLAKANGVSEEQQTRNANNTANLQLGGKSYNWMHKKAAPPTPAATSARLAAAATGVDGGKGAMKAGGAVGSLLGTDATVGQWREDSVGGKGVQMRDWVGVLEADGREKRTLCFAMARLGRERPGE